MKSVTCRVAALLIALLVAPAIVRGQAWPTKPIKIVAPFAAGGNVDVTARIVAEHLQPSARAAGHRREQDGCRLDDRLGRPSPGRRPTVTPC